MKTKDKLILAAYVDVSNIGIDDLHEYALDFSRNIKSSVEDESTLVIIIPGKVTKIEAVNPVFIADDKLKEKYEKVLDDIIKKTNIN